LRYLVAALSIVLGCNFTPQILEGDGGVDTGIDPPSEGGTEPNPEAGGPVGPFVRTIDVVDGKVTGGAHANFPVLISVTRDFLRVRSSGGEVEHPMGFDIGFFADAAATQPLAHEVEVYTPQTGALVAWVKVPSLSSATTIFLRYGDPAITASTENRPAVWSEGYAGVWHLTGFEDATNQNPGTNVATAAQPAAQIGAGRTFDGGGNAVTAASSASLTDVFAAGGTMEAWFFVVGTGGSQFGRLFDKDTSTLVIGLCDARVAGGFIVGHTFGLGAGNWCTGTNTVPRNEWVHVAVVYNDSSSANNPTVFLNGAASPVTELDSPTGAPVSDGNAPLVIGNRIGGGRGFDGHIDEARVSRVARDAGWIATSHENQRRPDEFITIGNVLE
jgi:hypothetical protein